MATRALTAGEKHIARSVYGDAIALDGVEIRRCKWFPLQPRNLIMAPCGHLHVHPQSPLWSEDYSKERLALQGLLVHELCHVWQAQQRGTYYLPLMRHPFCRYRYTVKPGRPLERYGLEQQAEILRHIFLLRNCLRLQNVPPLEVLESLLRF